MSEPRTIALCRTSTALQSIANQREAIQMWASLTHIEIAAEDWIEEFDLSGSLPLEQRPKLAALLARVACQGHGVARVVVCEWSRFGRVSDETLHRVMTLHRAGVAISVLDDAFPYDLSDPMHRMMLFVRLTTDDASRLDTIARTKRSAVRRHDGSVRSTRQDGTLGGAWGGRAPWLSPQDEADVRARLAAGETPYSVVVRGYKVTRYVRGSEETESVDLTMSMIYRMRDRWAREAPAAVPA